MMTPERKVKKEIADYLQSLQESGLPVYYEAREAGGFTYKKGLPDVWLAVAGRHIELEIKKPGGKRSTLQIKWEKLFNQLGIEYHCVESAAQVKDILKL